MDENAPPPPVSLIDRLRAIRSGSSMLITDAPIGSVRPTLTRIRKESPARRFTTRPEDGGVRVWRLS